MPRQRSEWSIEAERRYHAGERLIDIAKALGKPEGTVRRCKAEQGWDNKKKQSERSEINTSDKPNARKSTNNTSTNNATENLGENTNGGTPDKTNTQNPKARFGNKNAVGNKGGKGGPSGNDFAVKTNEYRNLFFKGANLDIDETKRAVLEMPYDKYTRQLILIDTLTYREMLILEEMEQLKKSPSGMVVESVTKNKGTTTNAYTNRNKSGDVWEGNSATESVDTATHIARSEAEHRHRLGEALTRVQGRLQKAIEVLHKMEIDMERNEIERAKLELKRQQVSGQIDLDTLLGSDDLGLEE